ncbi:MAG: hypothetical protein IT386_13850 [Deltaproteobacteria bacterium]|nr:hypothetical protein [Deltaproteobacteria bacterium]
MSGWPFVHVFALGVWMGCVGVESVLESLAHGDARLRPAVARMHFWIDALVEVPAFTLVAISGIAMLRLDLLHGAYAVMVVAGSVAIAVNLWCVLPVVRRKAAADRGDAAALDGQSRRIYGAFAIGVPCGLAALVSGVLLAH